MMRTLRRYAPIATGFTLLVFALPRVIDVLKSPFDSWGNLDRQETCAAMLRESAGQSFRVPTVLYYVKSEHTLCVAQNGRVVLALPAAHGAVVGAKQCEGDRKTPEGWYSLAPARTSETYTWFWPVGYPNAEDSARAQQQQCNPGGAIGIHGPSSSYAWLGRAQSWLDHSDGCITLDRDSMGKLRSMVRSEAVIRIANETPL